MTAIRVVKDIVFMSSVVKDIVFMSSSTRCPNDTVIPRSIMPARSARAHHMHHATRASITYQGTRVTWAIEKYKHTHTHTHTHKEDQFITY